MTVEQLRSFSKEDWTKAIKAERQRVYDARKKYIERLERDLARYKKYEKVHKQLQLLHEEIEHYSRVLDSCACEGDLKELIGQVDYENFRFAVPMLDREFPEMEYEPKTKKFRYALKLCAKFLQVERSIPVWEQQIENFKTLTPDAMKIQNPTLKVLTKWGKDPGKDTAKLYGEEVVAGVIWSPFIFRRHIPRKFKDNLENSWHLRFGDVTTVVTGLLKLGKNNPWFVLDSQLFSDKPTPDERWKDMYDRLHTNSYKRSIDYARVGYYYTKRDELAFTKGASKEDLIVESERILAMTRDEAINSAREDFNIPRLNIGDGKRYYDNDLGAASFSAFGSNK